MTPLSAIDDIAGVSWWMNHLMIAYLGKDTMPSVQGVALEFMLDWSRMEAVQLASCIGASSLPSLDLFDLILSVLYC